MSGLFSSIGKSMLVSRQLAANEVLAKALLHEYPNHTYHSLLAELNHNTIQGAYNDKFFKKAGCTPDSIWEVEQLLMKQVNRIN
jgi:hypothetical protein